MNQLTLQDRKFESIGHCPAKFTNQQLDVIRNTSARDLHPNEFDEFIAYAQTAGLNPFRKQVQALVFSKDKPDKRTVAYITTIDGYRAIADRQGNYRPDDDVPAYIYNDELKSPTNPHGIECCKVKVFKQDNTGAWNPIVGLAYWDEFVPLKEVWQYNQDIGKKQPTGEYEIKSDNWRRMGRIMIAKCAEAQALRKGWPENLSRLYTADEMEQADGEMIDVTPSQAAEQYATEKRLHKVGAGAGLPFVMDDSGKLTLIDVDDVYDTIMRHITDTAITSFDIKLFRDRNQMPLKQFWALRQADALDLRTKLDGRFEELEKAEIAAQQDAVHGNV